MHLFIFVIMLFCFFQIYPTLLCRMLSPLLFLLHRAPFTTNISHCYAGIAIPVHHKANSHSALQSMRNCAHRKKQNPCSRSLARCNFSIQPCLKRNAHFVSARSTHTQTQMVLLYFPPRLISCWAFFAKR